MEAQLKFKKTDLLAVLIVAVLAVSVFLAYFFASPDSVSTVEITMDGKLLYSLPLDKDCEIDVVGAYTNTVVIKDGKVCISKSDCPNHDCVYMGALNSANGALVCLPNGVVVQIVNSGEEADLDVR